MPSAASTPLQRSRRAEWGALAAVGLAAVSAGVFVGSPALDPRGFPLDDAWIFQVMARNLATTGVWGFTPGEVSSGATSTLWTLILAVGHQLRAEPVAFTWGVNLLLLGATACALYRLLLRDLDAPLAVALLALAPVALGNFVWLSATGMESLLLAFLSVAAVLAWRVGSQWAGCLCALAVLTRPEAVGLPLVLAAISLFQGRPRHLLAFWGPVALAMAAAAMLSYATSGALLPTTLAGRRWLYGFQGPSLDSAWAFARSWAVTLVAVSLWWPAHLVPIVAALVAIGVLSLRRSPGLAALCACALTVDLAYAVLLPSPGHGGRYQPLNLLLAPILGAAGLATLWRLIQRGERARRFALGVAAGAVVIVSAPSLAKWRAITAVGIGHIDRVHVRMANWVRDAVPAGVPVAAFDIGAMGYFSGHPVVDLGGLVDRSFVPFLSSGNVASYLAARGTPVLVLPSPDEEGSGPDLGRGLRLVGNPAVALRPLAEASSPRELWWPGFVATSHASPRLIAYHARWAATAARR